MANNHDFLESIKRKERAKFAREYEKFWGDTNHLANIPISRVIETLKLDADRIIQLVEEEDE